jgi:putative ABC transport system permease protein
MAVLTLVLGIGANTATSASFRNLLLRLLPYHHPEQLLEIANTYFPQVPKGGLTPGDYFDWRQQNASFSELGAFTKALQGFDLLGGGESRRTQ